MNILVPVNSLPFFYFVLVFILHVRLLFLQFTCTINLFSLVQNVYSIACFYCYHNQQQTNNSIKFIFIIVPTLLPDALNIETRIKRNIIGTHIEQRKHK
jgi:hypothetical protein